MPSLPFANALKPAAQLCKRLVTIPPKETKLTIGLDIGSSAVKVLALGPRRGLGARPLLGKHVVPLMAEQETDASGAIQTAVEALNLPGRTVNIGVSGSWVVMRVVEMPAMKPAEIKQAIPFEAQRSLPFNLQDVVVDGELLGPADANKVWVLIVACKKDLLERRIDWVKRAGLDVGVIDVDALAVANGFLASGNGRSAEGTRAILNVGSQLTNVVIFQNEMPYLVRDIPWGSEKLSRSIAEQVGADAAVIKDQLLKGQAGPEFLGAMKLAGEALVTEVQLSFDYFESRFGHPPEEILISGGLAHTPLFVEALKSHFAQTVASWTPLGGLPGQFAVAYGLALRTS